MDRVIYRGRIFNPKSADSFEDISDGALVVENSKIIEYDKFDKLKNKITEIMDFGDKIIMPGFVDLHVHLPQYDMIAMEGLELLGWLQNYTFPMEKRFEDSSVAREAASRFFSDVKKNGTTTACVYNTVHKEATDKAFKEAEKSGLRILMGRVMMDQNSPDFLIEDTEESLKASEELCSKWHNRGNLKYVFTPRFAPTCSRELMKETSILAKKYDAYIQTHLSENLGELAWVKELFPEAKNYTDVYERAGLLSEKTIMAHCIYLNEEELKMLASTRTVIAHCPSSNLFLKSGIFDVKKTRGYDIRVGLGCDVGGGPNLSMFKEMASACYVSKVNYISNQGKVQAIDPVYAFYLATLGGAEALGLEGKIGNFEIGKEADFIVVDYKAVDPAKKKRPGNEVLSQLVYRGDDRIVEKVFVKGKEIYKSE